MEILSGGRERLWHFHLDLKQKYLANVVGDWQRDLVVGGLAVGH